MKSLSLVSTFKMLLCLSLLFPAGLVELSAQTLTTTTGSTVTLTVSSTVIRDHTTNPFLLGFNVPWDSVQGGTYPSYADGSKLWNTTTKQIQPDLSTYLKTDFAGALYRYPGGTTANYFDWDKTIGTTRTAIVPNGGWPSRIALFGVDEFLRFVEAQGGLAMLQTNMYTINGTPITTDAQWATLKQSTVGWLEYCNAPVNQDWNGDGIYQGQLRANNGHSAAYNVTLWELGNELDLYSGYTADLYATRCREMMAAMLAVQPNLTFLAHARTAPWGDLTNWRTWHNTALASVGATISGVAWHPYYDGCSVQYMNNFTSTLSSDNTAWATGAGDPTAPGVSITEHAKWPANLDDQTTWPACTSISAAIGIVDFIISHQYKTYVQMALNHALTSNSPWAQFSQVDTATNTYLNNNTFAPRPTAYALKLAQKFLPNADLLTSSLVTPKTTSYEYDVRAIGFKYGSSGVMGAVFANRALTNSYPVTLTLPGWTAGNVIVRMDGLGGSDGPDSPLWKRYVAATVTSSSQAILKVPNLSAVTMQAISPDLVLNGNFEQGTLGAVPTSWERRLSTSTVTGTVALVADATNSVNGNNVVRVQKTNTASGGCYLVQPSWNNAAFTNTGAVVLNPNNTYVLRANVRTSSLSANSVSLKVQCFDSGGTYLSASPSGTWAPTDTAGKWTPLELEFVPATICQTASLGRIEVMLGNASSTGYVDVDGFTLQQRKNWVQYPAMQDSNANGVADGWENRIDAGTGTIAFTAGTPSYVRLTKTASGGMQFVQTQSSNSAALGINGALNARNHEKWRLKARVRYDSLNTSGAQLKVQCFDSAGAYRSASPSGNKLTGSNAAWVETTLEFNLRDIFGAAKFGRAEIMLQNNSTTGYIDVSFVSLEAVD